MNGVVCSSSLFIPLRRNPRLPSDRRTSVCKSNVEFVKVGGVHGHYVALASSIIASLSPSFSRLAN